MPKVVSICSTIMYSADMHAKRNAMDTLARTDRGYIPSLRNVQGRRTSATLAKRLSALEKKLDVALKDAEDMLAEIRAINRK